MLFWFSMGQNLFIQHLEERLALILADDSGVLNVVYISNVYFADHIIHIMISYHCHVIILSKISNHHIITLFMPAEAIQLSNWW